MANSCSGFQASHCQMAEAATLCLIRFQCSCYQGTTQQLAWRRLNTTCFSKVSICGSFTWVPTRENPQPTPLHQEQAIGSTHYRCEQQPILFFSISAINNQLVFGSCNKAAGGKQILSTALYPEWSTAALQYLLDGTTGTCTRCGHRNRKPADRLADKHKHFQV